MTAMVAPYRPAPNALDISMTGSASQQSETALQLLHPSSERDLRHIVCPRDLG